MASVELRGLTKRYGPLAVVDDVSLTIEHGRLVCLLGPSGCGKTTTLRLIAGFVEPAAGEIRVGDRVMSSPAHTVPPERRNMSMIFQSYALWPHMTVAQNVTYGLELRKVDRETTARKLKAILATTHLAELADRYPGELSGGQQQRVALARALIVEPETLLLDEPLSNLDANLREEMRFEVRRLHDEYRYTTVYVTHDQSEAMTTADVIAVMNAGKIEQAGSPEEIYERPRSEFVARFIGVEQRDQGQGARRQPPLLRGRDAALQRRQARAGRRGRDLGPPARRRPVGEQARHERQRGAGDRGAAGLSRLEPRLYGRGCGRHATARGHLGGRERSAGRVGVALSAAGTLPRAERMMAADCRSTLNETDNRRNRDEEADILQARRSARSRPPLRWARCARRPRFWPPRRRRPPSRPQLIEAAKKEGKVVYYTSIDLPIAETDRQDRSRRNIPAFRCGSSAPAPSACSSASARSTAATSTRSTWSTRRTPRISSSGSARAFLQPFVPEDVAKHYKRRAQGSGRPCSRLPRRTLSSSATTPIW